LDCSDLEDAESQVLQHVTHFSPVYMASNPRWLESSTTHHW